jgi:hypothetical protein
MKRRYVRHNMVVAKKIKVEVKKDYLEKIALSSTELALAEMIWNAFDADATMVEVNFHEGPMGVDEVTISDNGTGIRYSQVEQLFEALGGSWKAKIQKTEKGRSLHGKEGKGRFKAFSLGRVVQWEVLYKDNGNLRKYAIEGVADSLDIFSISDEETISNGNTGVKVIISEIHKQFKLLEKQTACEKLTPLFAIYLCNYPSVTLKIEGNKIDPNEVILNRQKFNLDSISHEQGVYPVELDLIEWNDFNEREMWFCDEKGFAIKKYNKQIRGIGEFSFSVYLKSGYFEYLQSKDQLELGEFYPSVSKICEQAINTIKEYFLKRTLEKSKDQLDKWKEEEVYPYENEPSNPVEKAERQLFDIVAINLNQNLPNFNELDKKTKTFQFRMLRQSIERSPDDLQLIISEVLNLPKKKQEQLAELLKDASLSGIISASKLVSDRYKFLTGLDALIFDNVLSEHLKERSQLHRILAENTWIFGDAFSLSVDDKSLTEVLRRHSEWLDSNIVIQDPVKRIDGTVGIVDLMLSRSIPRNHANELEHLVVELKAPKVDIGEEQIRQIKSYAFAVAKDERFLNLDTRWHFWVISKNIDDYAEMELSQERFEPGVIYKSTKPINMTIWIKTWSQIIHENKHRLEFIREKLNYNIGRDDALEYLRKTYAEYVEGVLSDETT